MFFKAELGLVLCAQVHMTPVPKEKNGGECGADRPVLPPSECRSNSMRLHDWRVPLWRPFCM